MQRFKIEYVIWISIISFSIIVSFQHNFKKNNVIPQPLTTPLFKHCMTKSTHFHLLTPFPFISSGKIANPLFLISPPTIRGRRVQGRAWMAIPLICPSVTERCTVAARLFLAREAKNLYWWPCNKCFYKKPIYKIPSVTCYQSSEKMAKRFQEGFFLHPLTPYLRHWHLCTYVDTRKT